MSARAEFHAVGSPLVQMALADRSERAELRMMAAPSPSVARRLGPLDLPHDRAPPKASSVREGTNRTFVRGSPDFLQRMFDVVAPAAQ